SSLGLAQEKIPRPRGYAMQLRVNMEVMDETGATKPTGGTLALFDLPSGPGVRVDTFAYTGYKTSAAFDSLLAKIIVHSPSTEWRDLVRKAARALRELRVGGGGAHNTVLRAGVGPPALFSNTPRPHFIDTHVAALVAASREAGTTLMPEPDDTALEATAALELGGPMLIPAGSVAVKAPLQGTIVTIEVMEGDLVRSGQQIAVLESMK